MLHLALICHACYTDLVTNFTNLAIIEKLSWSLCVSRNVIHLITDSHMM